MARRGTPTRQHHTKHTNRNRVKRSYESFLKPTVSELQGFEHKTTHATKGESSGLLAERQLLQKHVRDVKTSPYFFFGSISLIVLVVAAIVLLAKVRSKDDEIGASIQPVDEREHEIRLKGSEKGTAASRPMMVETESKNGFKTTIDKLKPLANTLSLKGKDKVILQLSSVDGEYYPVASTLGDKKKAANKLAELKRRSDTLIQVVDEKLESERIIRSLDDHDITANMRKLIQTHHKVRTPIAEYHNPGDKTVGSNSEKGKLIEICLRDKYDTSNWNSDNSIFRVHVHELAHSADLHYRKDGDAAHGPVFFRLYHYLLKVAEEIGIYSCEKYRESKGIFCGLKLTDEPECG